MPWAQSIILKILQHSQPLKGVLCKTTERKWAGNASFNIFNHLLPQKEQYSLISWSEKQTFTISLSFMSMNVKAVRKTKCLEIYFPQMSTTVLAEGWIMWEKVDYFGLPLRGEKTLGGRGGGALSPHHHFHNVYLSPT